MSWYTFGGILPGFASFLLIPIYTRYLTPADYGILASMAVLHSIASLVFILAIDRSVSRFYFDHKTESDQKNYFGTISISIFLTSTFMFLILIFLNKYVTKIFESIDFFPFFLLAFLISYFATFSRIPMIYLRLIGKAKTYVLISLGQFSLRMVLKIFFVVVLLKGVYGALLGGLIANIVFFFIFIYISTKISNFTFDKNILIHSLKFSLPMLPVILSAFIIDFSDRIFLEKYTSLSDLGIYSLGISIAGVVFIFSNSFNKAFDPVFYRIANSSDPISQRKNILSSYLNNYLHYILFICFSLALFSSEVIAILADKSFHEAYIITMIFSLSYVLLFSSSVFNMMIYQQKKSNYVMYSTFIAAPCNIILNFLLIPEYGIYGAGITTILSFLISFSVKFYFAKKCFYVPLNWSKHLMVLLILIGITIFCYYYLLNQSIFISLITKSGVFLLLLISLFRKITLTFLESVRNRTFTLVE